MNLSPWRKVKFWTCIKCGKCCLELDTPVTYDEEDRLKKYGDIFRRGKIGVYLKKVNGKCIFLRNNICAIYNERPEACRRYPFYLREKGSEEAAYFFKGKKLYIYIDINCPGVGKGDKVEDGIRRLLNDT